MRDVSTVAYVEDAMLEIETHQDVCQAAQITLAAELRNLSDLNDAVLAVKSSFDTPAFDRNMDKAMSRHYRAQQAEEELGFILEFTHEIIIASRKLKHRLQIEPDIAP